MFEFSEIKTEQKDLNKDVEFLDQPVQCHCKHCNQGVVSNIQFKNTWITFAIAFLVFILIGHFSICVLPFIWSLLQDTVHVCPNCLNEISRRSRINLPSFKNSVMTFRFGTCAVVLSRKYVIGICVLFLLVIFGTSLRWIGRSLTRENLFRGDQIPDTWENFIEKCGARSYLGNPLHARSEFNKYYYGKTVQWTGTLMEVSDSYFHKGVSIKMHPSQHVNQIADLDLSYDQKLIESLSSLSVGEYVTFNATLISMSMRKQPIIGILWEIKIEEKKNNEAELEAQKAMDSIHMLNFLFGGMLSGVRGGGNVHVIELTPHHPTVNVINGNGKRSQDDIIMDQIIDELFGFHQPTYSNEHQAMFFSASESEKENGSDQIPNGVKKENIVEELNEKQRFDIENLLNGDVAKDST